MANGKSTTSPVDLEEVQGNITPGFWKDYQTFLFLRFPADAIAVKAWLKELQPCIASAHQVATYNREYRAIKDRFGDGDQVTRFWRCTWVNAAFSAAGLSIIKPDAVAALLADNQQDAFARGICNRLQVFREPVGVLANWKVRDSLRPGEPGDPVEHEKKVAHALLIVGSETAPDVATEVDNQIALATRHGLSLISMMRGQTLGGGRDHLGFRDGISQPDPPDLFKGWTWQDPEDEQGGWPVRGSEQIAPPGLFIRGCDTYENVAAGEDPPEPPAWEKFGSYLVFRRFRQDIDAFKQKVRNEAERLRTEEGILPMNEHRLMAQIVGRWPSGAKLVKPKGPDDLAAAQDPFPGAAAPHPRGTLTRDDYFPDRDGEGCPMFAHVRTAFPRILLSAKNHRIIRRGITYTDDNGEKGLLFVGYQARIEDGFEFIQSRWLNRPLSPETGQVMAEPPPPVVPVRAGARKDPLDPLPEEDPNDFLLHERKGIDVLTAVGEDMDIKMIRPANGAGGPVGGAGEEPENAPEVVDATLSRLITIEGGGYFFSPSRSGLAALAGA